MLDNVKEIHIEPTSLCNAECPMCARNVYGKMVNPYIKLKSLPLSWFEENIQPEQIQKLDMSVRKWYLLWFKFVLNIGSFLLSYSSAY